MRAASWPVAEGRIQAVEVSEPTFSFTTNRGYYVAELGYSYSVAGTRHSGRYRREFPTEHDTGEFVRDLQDKAVAVHYKSTCPTSSALLESDIEVLLQNRAPDPVADFPSAANSVPDCMYLRFVVADIDEDSELARAVFHPCCVESP